MPRGWQLSTGYRQLSKGPEHQLAKAPRLPPNKTGRVSNRTRWRHSHYKPVALAGSGLGHEAPLAPRGRGSLGRRGHSRAAVSPHRRHRRGREAPHRRAAWKGPTRAAAGPRTLAQGTCAACPPRAVCSKPNARIYGLCRAAGIILHAITALRPCEGGVAKLHKAECRTRALAAANVGASGRHRCAQLPSQPRPLPRHRSFASRVLSGASDRWCCCCCWLHFHQRPGQQRMRRVSCFAE